MLHAVDLKTVSPDVFRVFGEQPPLLTAGNRNACNTMTIGWCQLGCLWGQPVCTVYVRPERHTYGFMEMQEYFSVSVLPAGKEETIAFCGTKSGRDVDKVAECGLTVAYGPGDTPYFEEAELVFICKKVYAQDMSGEFVTDGAHIHRYYTPGQGSWHRMYIGEVVEAYSK
jgi:flavin reductase (DIM6/NTAB) family NADH-FMN oxidoreductase RutF